MREMLGFSTSNTLRLQNVWQLLGGSLLLLSTGQIQHGL
jgi:hypothetical protein